MLRRREFARSRVGCSPEQCGKSPGRRGQSPFLCATSNMAGRHEVLPTVAVNGERSACHITDLDEEGPLDDIGGYHRLLSRNWRKSSGWASDALHSKVVFMTSVRKYWVNS